MKQAVVLGLGVSGVAATQFLQLHNYQVWGVDDKVSPQAIPDLQQIDLVVVSPGVSPKHPLYIQAQQKGIELIGEAELGLRFLRQRAVAITGTNGKTTVTAMTAHILNTAGVKAQAVGNIGMALTAYLASPDL